MLATGAATARSDFWAVLESAGLWLLVLLAGLALMLTMLLALQRTEAQLLRDARLALVLQEMRESVELELALGLDLADISQTRNLLENALRKDASLLSADVMNTRGVVAVQHRPGSVGETVVSAVIQARAAADQDRHQQRRCTASALVYAV